VTCTNGWNLYCSMDQVSVDFGKSLNLVVTAGV
jgi:hypothetical protein